MHVQGPIQCYHYGTSPDFAKSKLLAVPWVRLYNGLLSTKVPGRRKVYSAVAIKSEGISEQDRTFR